MSAYSEFLCGLAEDALDELLERDGRPIMRTQMRVSRRASQPTIHRVLKALRAEGVGITHEWAGGPRGKRGGGWACAPGSDLPEALKTKARILRELRATQQINYSYGRLIEALCHADDPAGAVAWLADQDDLEQHLVAEALARVATGRAKPVFEAMAGGVL